MAKLTRDQLTRQIERESKRQSAIKSKQKIQKEKSILGEQWRQTQENAAVKQMEFELGESRIPKIYDSKDLYDFFDPIKMYKDPNNSVLKMDYEHYMESERKFKAALEEIDLQLERLKEEENSSKSKKIETEDQDNKALVDLDKESELVDDGVNEEDSIAPLNNDADEVGKIKNNSPTSIAKRKINQIVSTYLNRFVPLYDRHICTCCGKPKPIKEYYVNFNLTCSGRVDDNGSYHMWICKECVQKLFAYYYMVLSNRNAELAMQYICATLNLYWDVDIFYKCRQEFEDKNRKGTLVGMYIGYINKEAAGTTFMDSPFVAQEQYNSNHRIITGDFDDDTLDWSPEDLKNKKDVTHLLGYDPFAYEEDNNDKKILYADLVSIIDEDIQQDYVKLQSALTIVKSFSKVRKIDERIHQLEKEDGTLTEQKTLTDLKVKELKAISDFSRDSGFSERFKSRQSQGETSFTGIMKKMNEKKYEDELINLYDIETSKCIEAVADASFKAIFNQLALSDAEVYSIASKQLEEIRKLRSENSRLEEDLRKAKYKIAEFNLKEKAREKGVGPDE